MLALSVLYCSTAGAATKPRVSFDGQDVVASVDAGARVVLIGVAREWNGWATALVKTARILHDDDRDGIILYPYPGSALPKSIWAVVDIDSGEYDIAVPHGWKIARKPIPAAAFVARGPARLGVLTDQRVAYLAVIRPGVGAWTGTVTDGTVSDQDASLDNRVEARLEQLKPLAETTTIPSTLEGGDIVLYVDPATLAVHDGRVVK